MTAASTLPSFVPRRRPSTETGLPAASISERTLEQQTADEATLFSTFVAASVVAGLLVTIAVAVMFELTASHLDVIETLGAGAMVGFWFSVLGGGVVGAGWWSANRH